MGKIWRPRRPAKAPLEAVGVKDAEGAAVTVGGEVVASVLQAPVVAATGGEEKGPLEDGIAVSRLDALDGAPVIAKSRQEAVAVKGAGGVAVRKMRRPRRPAKAKAPLEAVGVKDSEGVAVTVGGEVDASVLRAPVVAAAGGEEKGPLEDGIAVARLDALDGAPVITTSRQKAVALKDAGGKMWRPRRPAKAPQEAVGVKDAEGVAVIAVDGEVEASVLGAPVVAAAARGGEKGPLEDGTAVCRSRTYALDGAPVIATARQKAVGVKDAEGVAAGKVWQPRRPAKAPEEAVGVKDAEGVAVIAVDGDDEKGPLEDGIAVSLLDTLDRTPVIALPRQEAVGVKDAGGVAVRKMRRRRRPAKAKAPLEAVGVKDAEGVAVIVGEVEASVLGAPVVAAARGGENGAVEDVTAVCRIYALDGAPVIATTRHEAVGVKDAEGVAMGKIRRPRRSAKASREAVRVKDAGGVAVGKIWRPRGLAMAPLDAVGVKGAEGVAVIAVGGKVKASVLRAPMVVAAGGGPLEEGIAVCQMDALDGAPVIAMTRQEAVRVKGAEGDAVGKMWRPRRPAKAPEEPVGVKDAEGVAVIADNGGEEKGPLEDGIAVSWLDALDRTRVIATSRQEAVGVKDAGGVAVRKMRRPRRPAKAKVPLEVVGVKDAEGVVVIADDGKVEALVLGVPVVVEDGGGENGPHEEGIAVCQMDALGGAPVIATTRQEAVGVKDTEEVAMGKTWLPRPAKAPLEVMGVKDAEGIAMITVDGELEPLVLGVPVVVAARGGEKGSLEDGIAVCQMDALDGAPVIATDKKGEVLVQGDPVVPVVDRNVDAPVVERVQAIVVKGNGKEKKDEEGIKWLKHYSTAQSILIIGDGDFSFSLALATAFGSGENLVATSLDSYGAVRRKYGKAESNVTELKRLGTKVMHGVDAKTMKLHSYLETRRFDRIVFNFPHAGFKGKEDQLHVISAHKQLVHGFLANARHLLRPYGETHLSHKTGLPYDAWDIEQLAYESCLIMVRKVDFCKEDYPGYNQKRGAGARCDEPFALGPCCTFMFCIGDEEKLKQAHGNRVGWISSCLGGSKFYPGISATGMMWPFDLNPLAPAWPQPHFPPVNAVHMPIAFDPCPSGVAEMEHTVNCYGTSFHQPQLNVFSSQGSFHPPMGRISSTTFLEQPWYQEGPPIEPPWTPQEHQSLQREYHPNINLPLVTSGIPEKNADGTTFESATFRTIGKNLRGLATTVAKSLKIERFFLACGEDNEPLPKEKPINGGSATSAAAEASLPKTPTA